MRRQLLPALAMLALMTAVTGGLYPLVVTGVAQAGFERMADGSLIERDGRVLGSGLIAQRFTGARYFHPRPSAAGTNGYDAASSGASNLGPSNPALLELIAERAARYRADTGLASTARVPVDAVTASGSGLDPHISPANAETQARRVAEQRGLPLATVLELVRAHTEGRTWTVLGEPRVNVLELNVALDDRAVG